jgi:hypothetical protein
VCRVVLLAGLVVVISGCIPDTRPAACDAAEIEIALTLSESALDPAPAACRGQEVTLVVTSQVDGVLHIHGYDAEVPATPVQAGEVIEMAFTAGRSGQFPIELHPLDDPRGVSVAVFTVHEP